MLRGHRGPGVNLYSETRCRLRVTRSNGMYTPSANMRTVEFRKGKVEFVASPRQKTVWLKQNWSRDAKII